ncbi:hypothetical protein [Parendozoicomonas sp. Alg238-R29]|uniref:hypothetical protein n=1 Tax=Parendozoicomonas sp. Alg238-R29 TaxID=2993446 RepID=UPI00248E82B1|nr:hypothetical protein [Parendozoicomonas sp. Alg238-R29]
MRWPRQLVERVFLLAESSSMILPWRELDAVLQGSTVTIDDLLDAGLFIQYEEQKRLCWDGRLRELIPHPDTGQPSYFDGYDIEEIPRYARLFYHLQVPVLVEWLYQQLDLPDHNAPVESVPGVLWYLGEVRIPRAGFVPVWYGRTVTSHEETVQESCRGRCRATSGLILTSGVCEASLPGIKETVPVTDGFCSRELEATVDWEMLSFLYQGRSRFLEDNDSLLYTLSEDGDALIEKATGRLINLSGNAKAFFPYVIQELQKAPEQGVDFYKARDHAGYAATADTFGKMWSKKSPYRKIVMRRKSRIFFVPYGPLEEVAEEKTSS